MKKRKLKQFHPITSYIILILTVVLLSFVLNKIGITATYSSINGNTNEIEKTMVAIKNMLSYDGIKFILSKATTNFISFTTLSTLIITLIGLSVAEVTGLIQAIMKNKLSKLNPKIITFILFLLAVFSSIVNEVGYAILIPIGALLFLFNGRNPLAGIITAYAGVSFGYGISFFVGTMDINLLQITTKAAKLIDTGYYTRMTSNLFIMIVLCIIISIIGTFITEKYIIKKLGRYISKKTDELGKTKEIEYLDLQYEEQKKIKEEKREKRGLKFATLAGIIIVLIFTYMITPNLPLSGVLLDNTEIAYVDKLFGATSYFQDGFTYIISILFIVTGISYAIGAKTIKSDKDLCIKVGEKMSVIGGILITTFFAAQFIAIFKETNIGTVIVIQLTKLLKILPLSGTILIVVSILIIAISNIFLTSSIAKWTIISPTLVPLMMQVNYSPDFAQLIFRTSESMTNAVTPLLAYFVIYVCYLNLYSKDGKTYSITQAISLLKPYFIAITLTYIIVIFLWYIIGLPLGPNVYPNL